MQAVAGGVTAVLLSEGAGAPSLGVTPAPACSLPCISMCFAPPGGLRAVAQPPSVGSLLSVNIAGGPGELYDSACTVRELLRGRAVLLLRDRTDIAAAAGAEGVVLSPSGLPIAVAARSLSGPVLIGKEVSDAASATSAAKEGASLLVSLASGARADLAVQQGSQATSQRHHSIRCAPNSAECLALRPGLRT